MRAWLSIALGLALAAGGYVGWRMISHRWPSITARLWALAGNSRTIAVAYAAEIMAALDEAKIVDWSQLLGAERAGRVLAIMGVVMLLLRLITRTAVSFRAQP